MRVDLDDGFAFEEQPCVSVRATNVIATCCVTHLKLLKFNRVWATGGLMVALSLRVAARPLGDFSSAYYLVPVRENRSDRRTHRPSAPTIGHGSYVHFVNWHVRFKGPQGATPLDHIKCP